MTDGGKLTQLSLFDISRPSDLRTKGSFVIYLSEEAHKALGSGDLIDEKITVYPREIGVQGANIKLKGSVVLGIIQPADFTKAFTDKLPVAPTKKAESK